MKKSNAAKRKAAEGCMKISSFFTVNGQQPPKVKVQVPSASTKHATESVILISDEECENVCQNLSSPKQKPVKRRKCSEAKLATKTSPLEGKPSISGATVETLEVSSYVVPSTSGVSPIARPTISVKTPDKLLTAAALKQFYSPSKRSPTSTRKLKFDLEDVPSAVGKECPKNRRNSKSASESSESTPNKPKRTPPKLFEKSPKNLNEFNIKVINNFVKVTPKKEEKETESASKMCQMENERTPVKSIPVSPATNKVKLKLNFDLKQNITPHQKENCDVNNLNVSLEDVELNWDCNSFLETDYNLDLTEPKHCKIVNINQTSTEVIIIVRSTQDNSQTICSLQDFWMHCKLCVGDTVCISALKSADSWVVNNKNGFLVYEPDLLISTTSVANSVFCKRRMVLQERFRGFDSTNKYMIIGSMVHSLLQEVLRKKLYQYKEVEECALAILSRKDWVVQIYESGESAASIREEVLNYVPKVQEFIETYVKKKNGSKSVTKKKTNSGWQGTISDIEDIEENIWCPDLGLKGKVDVSIKNGEDSMPLEIKTGRASVSVEHRGQVLLYIMMMNKLGYRVSSGLLLYLKEGILKEIPSSDTEKRHLIMLRNELAFYLSRTPKQCEDGLLEPVEIPETIDHPSCRKCPYNAVCTAYSKHGNEDVSSKPNLFKIQSEIGSLLTLVHLNYFMLWTSLLAIEMPPRNTSKSIQDIYTLTPLERKSKGKCLIDLTVCSVTEEPNGTWLHTFKQKGDSRDNFLLSGFAENSYVVVSVPTRPAIASGFILDITLDTVVASLDRNVNKKYSDQLFFLDSYESTTFLNYNLSSLALILETDERAIKLRSIVIDRQPATFQPKLPKRLAELAKPILKRLNQVQQRAVLKAIAANDYFLIKGMPGTGKTATIVALIELLVEMKQTVLITSQTNSAVDTVCLKLLKFGVKFMRIGNEAKMDPKLRAHSERSLIKDCDSPEALDAVYRGVQVLAVTCLSSSHVLLSKRTMDVCIVDESTQVLQCSLFRPLYAAKKFILIGDPDQLPAVVRNRTALELGMNESLFERLDSRESCTALTLNYRMNEPITRLANELTYNGELGIGADRVAKASLAIPKPETIQAGWLKKALDTRIENSVQFLDTGPVWKLKRDFNGLFIGNGDSLDNENEKCLNIPEAVVIYRLAQALLLAGVLPNEIGVIATYRVQVASIKNLLKGVEVNTVDQFQGKDRNIIIYSCSKSMDLSKGWTGNKFDLTEDKRRLNVAITRARHKLIIVGDFATLQRYSTFKKIKSVLEQNLIKLEECEGFDWDEIMDIRTD